MTAQTIDKFRYTLNLRNIYGGSRSFEDLAAQRALLVEDVRRVSAVMGQCAAYASACGDHDTARHTVELRDWLATMLEDDIQSIDRFLEKRAPHGPK